MDSCAFWSEHSPEEAVEIACRILEKETRHNEHDTFEGRHYWRVGSTRDLDFSAIEAELRTERGGIDRLFVTTGRIVEFQGQVHDTVSARRAGLPGNAQLLGGSHGQD